MKRASKICMLIGLCITGLITGCGTTEEETQTAEIRTTKQPDYTKGLTDGAYYIRHSDYSCEQVYFPNATFDQGEDTSSGTGNNSRIIWFKDDFNMIPTMYAGESLIMYSQSSFDESFGIERYEDMYYSIGISQMGVSDTNRFTISTNPDDNNTYPGGDTDEILNLTNDKVILESIGGQKLRYDEYGNINYVSRAGTLSNLTRGNNYKVAIYDGTVRHDYDFTADVRIMASMSRVETVDYEFEDGYVINIKMPEGYKSGYYMINGLGVFRYVNGTSFDPDNYESFNVPNNEDEEKILNNNKNTTSSMAEYSDDGSDKAINGRLTDDTFTINSAGWVKVEVAYTRSNIDTDGDGSDTIKATIVMPSGTAFPMDTVYDGDITFRKVFNANETGQYAIQYTNMDDGSTVTTVSAPNQAEINEAKK